MSISERSRMSNELFGENGIVWANIKLVFQEKCKAFLNSWADFPVVIKYISSKVLPVIEQNVLRPFWEMGTPVMWTNNNAESLNNVIKHSTD